MVEPTMDDWNRFIIRVKSFLEYEDGWYNGDGFKFDELKLTTIIIQSLLFLEVESLPSVWSTPDNEVEFEWISGDYEASLTFDMNENYIQCSYFRYHLKSRDSDYDIEFNVFDESGWIKVSKDVNHIRSLK